MTVITVNKVQDIYNTPVYKLEQANSENELLIQMNQLHKDGVNYDMDFYGKT